MIERKGRYVHDDPILDEAIFPRWNYIKFSANAKPGRPFYDIYRFPDDSVTEDTHGEYVHTSPINILHN